MKALEVSDLHKTYKSGVKALKGVNLDVEQGDFFALLGPNGAGKSTTIGIVTSLVNKSHGIVKIFGYDIDQHSVSARLHIGLVPQEFNFNIFELVGEILVKQAGYYGIDRRTAQSRAEKYLKQLELWDKRQVMARELSGGMKRRLMIARALIHEPKLLILDEPTAGVDVEIRHAMWDFLRGINQQGTTIILTTHYLEEAERMCNNIAIIDNGVTIEHSSMRSLLDRLQKETFVLHLENHVEDIPACPDYEIRILDDNTIEVDVDKDQSISALFAVLNKSNINVVTISNKTNRLEQLFMNLVNNDHEPKSD